VGARLYFIVQNYDDVKGDLLGNLFSGAGLVWYGGAIGGTLGRPRLGLVARLLRLQLLDLCAAPLALGYAIGRIGCQVSGDGDYGKAWGGPWAMAYPDGDRPDNQDGPPHPNLRDARHGPGRPLLWRWRDRFRPGILFALYLVFAGLERFLVEFVRRNDDVLAGLTGPQLESLALLAAGLVWLALARRRGGWQVPGGPARVAPA
jgi:phosphatidylglycerol:prolipoprotein diacylglycerol transferase